MSSSTGSAAPTTHPTAPDAYTRPMRPTAPDSTPQIDFAPLAPRSVFAWALYVGTSWTWCIGMFLPIILLRDFGIWSLAFFAIPNVVGAAMTAWIFNPQTSAAFVARHYGACSLFSIVTGAFNAFFLLHLILAGASEDLRQLIAAAALLTGGVCIAWRARPTLSAIVVFTISVFAIAWALFTRDARSPLTDHPSLADWRPASLAIAPVLMLGFLTCPWFDLTFQRAVRHSAGQRKPVFALGFGLFFFAMICFTPFYAAKFVDFSTTGTASTRTFLALASLPIAIHLACQLALTIVLHAQRNIAPLPGADAGNHISSPATTTERESAFSAQTIPAISALALLATAYAIFAPGVARLTSFETVYMLFMSFYGLAIPAYALNCAIPTADSAASPTRAKLIITALAILAASPFFVQGFLLEQPNSLVLGVGVLFLSRAITMALHRRPRQLSTAIDTDSLSQPPTASR